MTNYQEARAKLTNKKLSKWKSGAKNKTGTILRLNKKNFEDEGLFLTTKQTTKIRNTLIIMMLIIMLVMLTLSQQI